MQSVHDLVEITLVQIAVGEPVSQPSLSFGGCRFSGGRRFPPLKKGEVCLCVVVDAFSDSLGWEKEPITRCVAILMKLPTHYVSAQIWQRIARCALTVRVPQGERARVLCEKGGTAHAEVLEA
jgi:hypothetical protein